MDRAVIDRKLESLRRCLDRIQSKLPLTAERIRADYDLQDIISINLKRAVQACIDMAAHVISEKTAPPPSTMGEGFGRLAELNVISVTVAERMQKAVAFRNILVHNYTEVNWNIVLSLITHNLLDFQQFAQAIDQATNENGTA